MPITALADPAEHDGWDHDTGNPTTAKFASAVQVWAIAQDRDVTVGEAALAFNATPELIRQAVEDEHSWMLLEGPEDAPLIERTIGHDGE